MSDHAPELNVGNIHDDDAETIEDRLRPAPNPPLPAIEPGTVVLPSQEPPATSRIMSGSMTLPNNWDPQQILPPDPYRLSWKLTMQTTTATDFIYVADDAAKCVAAGGVTSTEGAGRVYPNDDPFDLPFHTGPVWVSAKGSTGSVIVSWWAVTNAAKGNK